AADSERCATDMRIPVVSSASGLFLTVMRQRKQFPEKVFRHLARQLCIHRQIPPVLFSKCTTLHRIFFGHHQRLTGFSKGTDLSMAQCLVIGKCDALFRLHTAVDQGSKETRRMTNARHSNDMRQRAYI